MLSPLMLKSEGRVIQLKLVNKQIWYAYYTQIKGGKFQSASLVLTIGNTGHLLRLIDSDSLFSEVQFRVENLG